MQLLPVLKEGGYRLGVLSNREKSFTEEMETLGLGSFFEVMLAGGELRMWKPEPHLFVHACEVMKVKPTEAAYVGDNYFADVIGARRAGLRPVLYDPRGIFPDPGCLRITSFGELQNALQMEVHE